MSSRQVLPWLKVYPVGWVDGSIRATMTAEQRGVWIDLLCLASVSRVRGCVCRSKGLPFTRAEIATRLKISEALLNETIALCCADKNTDDEEYRMKVDESGCLFIVNFDKYQDIPLDRMPESDEEKRLRELRLLSRLQRQYPEAAGLRVSEKTLVDVGTGEILKKEQRLIDSVHLDPEAPELGPMPEKDFQRMLQGKGA